jgi:hypothetical protein
MLKISFIIETDCFVCIKAKWLIVFKEEIFLYFESYKRDINKICRHASGSVISQVYGTVRILTIVFWRVRPVLNKQGSVEPQALQNIVKVSARNPGVN